MPLRLEWTDDIAKLQEEWGVLAERSGNVFATWEWAATWWRHFGTGRPEIALWRDERAALAAIVPLYSRRRGPLSVARFIGHGPADELGPVCALGDPRAGEALALTCDEAKARWGVLLAERLPVHRSWARPVGSRVLQRESSRERRSLGPPGTSIWPRGAPTSVRRYGARNEGCSSSTVALRLPPTVRRWAVRAVG